MTKQPYNKLPQKTDIFISSLLIQIRRIIDLYILRPYYNHKNFILGSLGWYGVTAVIGSYFLVSFLIIEPDSISYQLLNATGALGLARVSLHKKTYQPTFSNSIWAIIAIVALIKIFFL